MNERLWELGDIEVGKPAAALIRGLQDQKANFAFGVPTDSAGEVLPSLLLADDTGNGAHVIINGNDNRVTIIQNFHNVSPQSDQRGRKAVNLEEVPAQALVDLGKRMAEFRPHSPERHAVLKDAAAKYGVSDTSLHRAVLQACIREG